jgi:hypothetical protein
MKIGKRANLYAMAGMLTTGTGNKVAAGRTGPARRLHVVPALGVASAPPDIGTDLPPVDWSQVWPYGGDAA